MTRDEFIDIMSKIDERLIDEALDISQSEAVEVVYERPPVLRYILSIAACIAVLVTAAIAVSYFRGITTQPGSASESSSSVSVSDEPDFIRGWDPEKLVYNELDEPALTGGNVRACTAELDGITAELILHNVKKEAGTELVNELTDFEYTDYYGAEDIVLYVHDDKGRRFIAEGVTPHSYNGMQLININSLYDSVRLYKTENGYALMLYADYVRNTPVASFYALDFEQQTIRDENGIYDASDRRVAIVGNGRVGGWQYGYQASEEFEYVDGVKFRDLMYGYELYLGERATVVYPDELPEGYEDIDIENITGWDPERLMLLENTIPTEGTTVIVASDSFAGLTASLILHNVVKLPGEQHYIYSEDKYPDMWAAESICLYITDAEGKAALLELPVPLTDGLVKFIPAPCVSDGCIKVLRTHSSGEEHYAIMLYLPEKDGGTSETYIQGDLDQYADSPKDENGIYLAKPIFTNADYFSPDIPIDDEYSESEEDARGEQFEESLDIKE